MSTTTLLVVIGFGVLVKTSIFLGVLARRDRRQRRALETVRATAARAVSEAAVPAEPGLAPTGWRLQWAEPGVLLLENADDAEAVRDVELAATLTAACGRTASVSRRVRFVGTGACFEARFGELEPWLEEALVGTAEGARHRLACTLDYVLVWHGSDGETRQASRTGRAVVPVPDLALETV